MLVGLRDRERGWKTCRLRQKGSPAVIVSEAEHKPGHQSTPERMLENDWEPPGPAEWFLRVPGALPTFGLCVTPHVFRCHCLALKVKVADHRVRDHSKTGSGRDTWALPGGRGRVITRPEQVPDRETRVTETPHILPAGTTQLVTWSDRSPPGPHPEHGHHSGRAGTPGGGQLNPGCSVEPSAARPTPSPARSR